MKDSKTFWDNNAQRYAKSRIQDETAYRKKLEITQHYLQPDWSVLEFGCGTGSTAMVHAPYVKEVLATDISDNMLAIAAQKAKDAGIGNIRFQQGTLESINPPAASFDAVLGLYGDAADMPEARSAHTAVEHQGGLYLFGGEFT